jgi:RNA polymerase sigma factor (sigma-70 family)
MSAFILETVGIRTSGSATSDAWLAAALAGRRRSLSFSYPPPASCSPLRREGAVSPEAGSRLSGGFGVGWGVGLSQNRWFRYLQAMRARGRESSKEAFEELYDRIGRRLLLYLVRRLHDLDAATELWAECWAAAFAGWSRCRARSESELEAWMFGIARNQLGSYYRSGGIASRTLEQLRWTVPSVGEGERAEIERDAELATLRVVLREALERLSPMRRRAVELRVLDARGYAEVAARLGCSEQAARAHVSRGLRQLERQMNRDQLVELQGANP